uniref:Pappalysin-1 SD scarf domain-containing protein n=1 Tax=Parascaris univalens TaxID=6257 RepID=A0A915ABE1_PARUN
MPCYLAINSRNSKGAPDAERCAASTKAWLPDVQNCDDGSDKCTLKVRPDIETQLEKLSIWIAWNAASGVRTVKVQIRTNNPFVSVDAVRFVSPVSDPRCSICFPFAYRVRTPGEFAAPKFAALPGVNATIDAFSAIVQKYHVIVLPCVRYDVCLDMHYLIQWSPRLWYVSMENGLVIRM